MANLKLRRPKKKTLIEQVVQALRECVVTGQLAPGQALPSELRLSAQLGVARATVREACKVLLGEGLLVRGKDGLCVAPDASAVVEARLTPVVLVRSNLDELYAARRVVEGELAAMAAVRATDEDVCKLEELTRRLERAQSPDDLVDLDLEFHEAVAQIAGNSVLAAMWKVARDLLCDIELRTVNPSSMLALTINNHRALIEALRTRDADAARECVRQGLTKAEEAMRTALREVRTAPETAD